MSPLATVVIVTWNRVAVLAECLASVEAQTLPRDHYDVVVVDNASDDGTGDLVAERFPDARLIRSERNLGFAGGANLALREVTTPYAVLLNNDAIAAPGFLAAVIDALDDPRHCRVGAVTGRVLLAGTNLVNSTGGMVSRTGRGYDRDWRRPVGEGRGDGEVFGFCGAAAGLRVAALKEVGLLDESLFLYYEDTDLSWRLRAADWSIRHVSSAVVHHRHASSSVEGSPLFHLWNERNSMVVFTRHAPAEVVVAVLARRAVGLLAHTARRGWRHPETRARWTAAGQYLRRLPGTLRERRALWNQARRTRRDVAQWLTRSPLAG